MKRFLTLLLAAVMLMTTAMPTLALSDFAPQPDEECFTYEAPVPDAATYDGCDIDIVDEMGTYIDLDVFEQWMYEVFRNCPTTAQYFTSTTYSTLGSQLSGKLPSTYSSYIRDYIWYWCPRLFQCFSGLTVYTSGSYVSGFKISGYKYDAATYQSMMTEIEANVGYFTEGLEGDDLTDLQKVIILHDRIVNWTEYDYAGYVEKYENGNEDGLEWSSYTMYGTLVRRESVCMGISQTQCYIGKLIGVDIRYCHSETLNHAWNIVILDGERYYMDTTWDDPTADFLGRTRHTYLLCSKDTFGHDATTSYFSTEEDVDYERTCTDTTYDSAFWKSNTYSSMQLVNNDYVTNGIYYINNTYGRLMKWNDPSNLTDADNEMIYSTGYSYAGVASDGEHLYFTSGRTVYEWDFATETAIPIWTLPATLGSSYKIYGIQYDNRAAGTGREVSEGVYSGSKLWVKAGTEGKTTLAAQFDNVFEVDTAGTLQNYSTTVTNGTASPATALAGETVTIKANAAESGMTFDCWTVDEDSAAITIASASSSQTTFIMPSGNVKVTATYKVKPTTMPETGYGYLVNGDFSVSSKTDSGFGWKTDRLVSISVADGVATVVNGNETRKGLYERIDFAEGHSYTITGTVADLSGELKLFLDDASDSSYVKTLSDGDFTYTFTATADMDRILFGGYKSEYTLSNITLTDNTDGGETTATATAATTASTVQTTTTTQTESSAAVTYTVTATNGTADKSSAEAGETVTLTAGTAPDGYTFDAWTSSDVTFANANSASTTFTMPAKNVSVTATFKKISYTVSVTLGSASVSAAGVGDTVTITADAAASGMTFNKWVVKSGSTAVTFADANSSSTTFVMPAGNVSVEATYENEPEESGISAPSNLKAVASTTGITLSWDAVDGATGYRVYKKVDGVWETVKTVKDGATSLVVSNLDAGVAYTFTVQAYVTADGETAWGNYDAAGVTATASFGAPDVGSATANDLGIDVTWAKVSGASGYRIYRRTVENETLGSWKTVATVSDNSTVSYTDTTVIVGAEYAYTVQAYTGSGATLKWSTYDPVGTRGHVTLAQPVLGTATKVTTGVTVIWNAVDGATGYRIYRWDATANAYKTVKTVTGASVVSYTDTNSKAVAGAKYTVQAFHVRDGVVSWSEPNTTGMTVADGSSDQDPVILGSEDIDLVTLTYFDEDCTEYGVSFHSFVSLTSPKIQVIQGTATSEDDFASAREIAVTDSYTKTLNEFDNYSKTTYEFDYEWANRSSMVTSVTTYIYQGVMDSLDFNTTYSYRVGDSSSDVWSGIYTFTTRASTVTDFSVIYTADTQPENSDTKGYKGVATILQKAVETAPDASFFVSGGDFVYCSDDGMSSISPWRHLINGSNNLMGSNAYFAENPWFVANGNHDNNYVQYFFNNDTTSTTSDYYSYDYGDVHFIVLDSGHNGSLDSTQLSWLESDLQSTQKKFKVVFIHWPFYCHEERDLSGDSRNALTLFDTYDVDFVISAHVNEDYYTTYPINNGAVDTTAVSGATVQNGVTYYTDPTGPIYLQNAGSGMDGDLTMGGEVGVMYVGKNDGGETCSYPDLMMHTAIAGYESSYLILKVEGNKLSVNRYYLDSNLQSQLYTVGQVGVIKN